MSLPLEILRGLLVIVCAALIIGWFLWRWLENSADPALLIFRWVFTIVVLSLLAYVAAKARAQLQAGDRAGAMIVLYAAVGGVTMSIVWVPVLTEFVGRLFGSLFDGGSQEIEPKPFYSIFRAKRSKGKYFDALAEVRRQLGKFPTDFEGQMLLAELQAENLNDLPGAALTVQRFYAQPEQTPRNISYALNRLADWHLDLIKDRAGAQEALEKIMELLPNTEMAARAAQRIAHLAGSDMLLATHDRQNVPVKKGVENLGLRRGADGRLKAPEVDQEKLAAEYAAQLEQHPQDSDAREKLAIIFARHYHRLDLAVEQLEQLIQQPNLVSKQVVNWLNLMADFQVQEGAEEEQVRATLQRIVDLYPEIGAADGARRRMDRLKLELKGKEKTRAVAMGDYEQNIGLKRGVKPV